MDIYYIDTIEQVDAPDEEFPYNINEYGARTQWKLPYDAVYAKFSKKVSDVAADLKSLGEEKKHYYMDIKLINSDGGILEKKKLGTRQEVEPRPEPEPEPEENVEEG